MAWWWLLNACSPSTPPERPGRPDTAAPTPAFEPWFRRPPVWVTPPAHAPLSYALQLTLDRPTSIQLVARAPDHEVQRDYAALSAEPTLSLLGLRFARDYDVELLATDAAGAQQSYRLALSTPSPPHPLPVAELLQVRPDLAEPGWTLVGVDVPRGGPDLLLAYDLDGEVVWSLDLDLDWGDVRLLPDQTLAGLADGKIVQVDPFGRVLRRWTAGPELPVDVPVAFRGLNHEAWPLTDGGWLTLSQDLTRVSHYPTSEEAPHLTGPGWIADPLLLHLGPDGETVRTIKASDFLDVSRIGFGSVGPGGPIPHDWAHANGLIPGPEPGELLVSLRHQDAVVALDSAGEVTFIVANPQGWSEDFRPYLLEPVGEPFSWPFHAHAPAWVDDLLILFDNGNYRSTPYDGPAPPMATTSRAVAYRVDREARTIEQAWEIYGPGELFSPALGDADLLPQTGQVLITFGFLDEEDGVPNAERGWGRKSVRLIEAHPERPNEPVFDLRLRSEADVEPEGWSAYRAERIPELTRPFP